MSKIYKSVIGAVPLILVAGMIGFYVTYDDDPMMATMIIAVAAVPMMLALIVLAVHISIASHKKERLEKNKELQMHRHIRATIDDVVDIQKQQGSHTYKVYTDTDAYIVDCEETSSKIIHIGEYQRVDIEG